MVRVGHLTQTLYYQTPTGMRDEYGTPGYGSLLSTPCRVQAEEVRERGSNDNAATRTVVYTSMEIPLDSRVWLPGANTADTNACRALTRIRASPHPSGSVTLYKYQEV